VVVKKSRVGADAAIGVITIASFALGVALFAKFGSSGPSFENALFGSILGITTTQIIGLALVSVLAAAFLAGQQGCGSDQQAIPTQNGQQAQPQQPPADRKRL
jgi:ABC-type Mn2+/Zn2+ transport system permease subunit